MRKIGFSFLAVLLFSSLSWALALPSERDLSDLMLDQKDPLFYEKGVIKPEMPSSLCGPTSAVNWLQLLQEEGHYTKEELVRIVKIIGHDLRQKNIEMNNGLTEAELIKFLELLNDRLGEDKSFIAQSVGDADIWNDQFQILLLNYTQPIKRTPGPLRRDDFQFGTPPISGRHFVLKVKADAETSELWLLDPENPTMYTIVKAEPTNQNQLRLRPQNNKAFNTFGNGIPLIWTATNAIGEK